MRPESNLLRQSDDLRAAVSALEKAGVKLCIVVDDNGRVLRTVTDGDIRRGLIAGLAMTDPISDLQGTSPVTMLQGTGKADLIMELDNKGIDVIVLTDEDGRPTGLADRTSLTRTLFLSPPHMGDAEAAYVKLAFDENFVAPAGSNLVEFEAALCRVSGRAHALAVSSGTAGLHLALRVLDIGSGDRVYVSDLTFVATVQPVLYERATPMLIDAEPVSWNMSPEALARALARDAKAGQLPKAIVVVHLYGQPADMAAIMALATQYDVPVIEDAAESLGASCGNLASGAHGLLSVYSFNGNKIITTSGGGALVSDRPDLIRRAQKLATQGRDPAEHYQHSEIAYNYRMSNVLAGIGRGQLEVLRDRVTARREIHDRYVSGLGDIPGVSFQSELPGTLGNRWLTVISLDPDETGVHAYQLMRSLRTSGIETRPAWKPMQMQPLLRGAEFEPHSETLAVGPGLFLRTLCLPSGSAMTARQQDGVIASVRDVLTHRIAA
ncbi:aminotransferase class I/II-fold pyridoxal phosphate-dependent enzyme [Roseobacter ponti]|uniref:Aminotransferase class I/II-fold pyridoxal phosphate-dependent enzyme n=1 Tax=Roseobacter ponti TaxID=1891787 RepID=A0A858SX83_9RHOB|nr:aminotransferase class I/II-fold pyridoxal phosphate-dependent enzyme [Roseobacter ponti]QJF52890.1 aminotransferase class I/II-fold pyridoxal phosphate-dependent enzyme [Roseobacter ponti]